MKLSIKLSCFLISAALLSYTILRAFNIGFTHDESYSYLYASHDSFMQIISNRTTEISANNHILNTLFMKLFDNTLGSSELSLRLQSIFAHILYLSFTFLLLKQFRSAPLIVAGFIILNVNPYMLDFFSLARGYALSISFMLISIYYFILYTQDDKNKLLIYSMIAACIAVLSNFALLNYYAALLLIHQVVLYLRFKDLKTSFTKSKSVLIIFIVMIIICYEPLRKLIKYERFDFGGNEGIWADTVSSLINFFIYKQTYHSQVFPFMEWFVFISLIVFILILLSKFFRGNIKQQDKNGFFIFSALILILLFNSIQHSLFGSPYFMERFALFLTPLYLLALIHALNVFIEKSKAFIISGFVILALITGGMSYHFYRSANVTYALNWDYDASTKQMLLDLEKEKEGSGKQKIRLGITWLFEPAINFYRESKKLDWLEKVTREDVSEGQFDYYYVSVKDPKDLLLEKTTIKEYPVSESRLMK
jgi:uncharacterized membrane protein